MADPIRRRLVEVLASGEHTSGNLADVVVSEFHVTRGAMQNHLRILREHGWVDYRQEESTRWYHLEEPVWLALDTEVRDLKELWRQRTGIQAANDDAPWLPPDTSRVPRPSRYDYWKPRRPPGGPEGRPRPYRNRAAD